MPRHECIFALQAVKESSRDCFCFLFFFPRPLAHGVEGVAETYRKEQVGSAFYRQPCDCKESVWRETCREAGNSLEAQSDVFHAAAETSRVILRSAGEELSFVYL